MGGIGRRSGISHNVAAAAVRERSFIVVGVG